MTSVLLITGSSLRAAELDLPPRPASAPSGTEFARSIADLPLKEREEKLIAEWVKGNVPHASRTLVPVAVENAKAKATYEVTADYLAIGSDADSFLAPMTPFTAQKIADRVGCLLPTSKMVDDIYAAATIKLNPSPIPPTPAMTTVPCQGSW